MAACALFATTGVYAQKDVTSQYITNATLSSLNGWTNVNFNTPVKGNNTTGYASECYAGWGTLEKTNYSLTQKITLPAGNYTLVNYSFFRQGEAANTNPTKSLAYLKAGENQVALKTLGSITATGYANSQAEGANAFDSKMYRNTLDFTVAADNTEIEIGLYGTFDEMRSWIIAGMFELIDRDQLATMDSPFDVTGYITNPGFEYRDMTGWTLSESGAFGTQGNNQSFKVGGFYAEKWQSASAGALSARSMSQTLTDLPAGYYKLTVNLGGNGTYVDLNGKTANWTEDKNYTVGYVLSEGESLTIKAGKTAEGTANWIHFDNFKLQFCGDVKAALTTLLGKVSSYQTKLPASLYNTLVTNTSAYDKDYSDVDELLAAIGAVQDLLDDADQKVVVYQAIKALIESEAAKAATLDAAGKAAYDASVVQGKYDNGTYTTVAEAEADLYTAMAAAVKAQTTVGSDWTGVIINPSFESDFTGWTNTGMVAQGNTSFGKTGTYYAESWKPNGTKSLTQTIEGMPAGVYKLTARVKARGVTSAKIYAAGVETAVTIGDVENNYSVEFACDANANITIGFEGIGTGADNSWLCVDNFTMTLVSAGLPDVTAVEGKMNATVAQTQTNAIAAYNNEKTVANYNVASAAIAAAQNSVDAYAAGKAALDKVVNILANTNLYTADAYNTFNGAFETAQGKYNDGSWTSEEAAAFGSTVFGTGWRSNATVDDFLISAWDVNPREWSTYHVNTWSTTDDSGNPNFVAPCIEYWTGDNQTLADKVMTATLPDFTAGAEYKVIATVCLGINTGVDASTAPEGITLQVNDGTAVSVCTGSRIATTRFYEGQFEAEGMIGMDGKLNVKFNVASTNVSWMTFRNVKYVKVSDAATPSTEDLAALAAAITAAEGNTLGFENGDYAPYNNVEAVQALEAAKDAQSKGDSKLAVISATTALTAATWTANTAEVNAIFWKTDYAETDKASDNYIHPLGWTNTGYNTRVMNTISTTDAAMATIGTAIMSKYNTTYGETVGYTMPLKANKIYKITFKYCGWGNNPTTNIVLTDPNNNTIQLAPGFRPASNDGNSNAEHWYDYTGYFVSTTAGDYVLAMNKVESGQQQIAWADMKLFSAEAIEFADGSVPTYAPGTYPAVKVSRTLKAEKWATAIYPFAVSGVGNIAVVDNYTASDGVLNFTTATASEANVPFLMRSAAGTAEINLTNVEVKAAAATAAVANETKMIGVYAETPITNAEKNYVLSDNVIYAVGAAGATIPAYRAYFQVAQPASGRALTFTIDGGVTTAIEGISVENNRGDIYNLNGQRVDKAQKGLYIVNGKKVVVK